MTTTTTAINVTPELLEEAGESLYGHRWKNDMAHDLGVNPRTIRRWTTGEWPVPSGLGGNILRLLEEQATHIAEIIRKLRAGS